MMMLNDDDDTRYSIQNEILTNHSVQIKCNECARVPTVARFTTYNGKNTEQAKQPKIYCGL